MVDGVWTSGSLWNVVSPVLTFSAASCSVAVTDGYISKAPGGAGREGDVYGSVLFGSSFINHASDRSLQRKQAAHFFH